MKRIVSSIFVVCLIFSLCLTAYAAEIKSSVVDECALLSDAECVTLANKLDAIRAKYNVDIAFVSTERLVNPAGAEASADDYFDYQGYGFGENRDGILFYICMETRGYHFSTSGSCIRAFTDSGISYLKGKVEPLLKASDYAGATDAFATTCEELLEMAANGEPYDKKDIKTVILLYVAAVGGAVILAFALTSKKEKEMKTAVRSRTADNYMKPGSMNIGVSQDIFLYSNVNRFAKPKETSSSSGSGSSTHTSSSGRTHGGGGGSF